MQLDESLGIDGHSLTDFNKKNADTFKEIEGFLLTLNDFIQEKEEELKGGDINKGRASPSRKELSSIQLEKANTQI